MLNPRRVYDLLHVRPFEPLEFRFSDGTTEIVKHPENAVVSLTSVQVAQFSEDELIPDWWRTYSLAHVARIEPVRQTAT